MTKPDFNATAKERAKGMVELRDCVQKLISEQMDGFISDETIRQTQAELNTLYDGFTASMGLLTPAPTPWPLPRTVPTICSALWRSWTRTKTSSARRICSPGEPYGRTRP